VDFDEGVVFQQRHPGFLGGRINNDPLAHVKLIGRR
jgi:hypothetical protein